MNKEELIKKLKPYMYCYVGSGMLSNDYDENTALSFANSCADIAEEYALEEKKKEAITLFGFMEWASHSDWAYLQTEKLWYKEEYEKNITPKTTEQLYDLYLNNKQK